jgi:hypothetical protein
MKNFRLYGKIRKAESGRGIAGLIVEAVHADLFIDELAGAAKSGRGGSFSIDVPSAGRAKSDLYLNVKTPDGRLIASTRSKIMTDVKSDTEINVDIPRQSRIVAGLEKEKRPPAASLPGRREQWTTWTFLADKAGQTSLMRQIQRDMSGKTSILELMKQYMDELYLNPDNNSPQFNKLMEIFRSGATPEAIEGHVYGVWMFFRTGDQEEPFSSVGNILQVLLGTALDEQCPWVGKTFTALSTHEVDSLTEGAIAPDRRVFRAVNHFRKIDRRLPNNVAFELFNIWNGLDDAPPDQQEKFGHQKNGGYIIAVQGPSIYPPTEREVFILNYRWRKLANKPPLCWLIDEVVQIADGLYLGQILSATRRLLRLYDPLRPPADYVYQTFGYFLMFSGEWNEEAQRLFPFLDIPSLKR